MEDLHDEVLTPLCYGYATRLVLPSHVSETRVIERNRDHPEATPSSTRVPATPANRSGSTSAPSSQSGSLEHNKRNGCNDDKPSESSVMDMRSKLFVKVADPSPVSSHKITIVGTGAVGMACAYSLLNQGVTSDLCLIDVIENRVKGEQLDLQHGSALMHSARIEAGIDMKLAANSKIIVICAGARQKDNETRLSLLGRNYNIFKSMIPELAAGSPNAIFLVVSNPVDILTHLTWKLSGFPRSRVIGAGTNLDTSRFRFLISQKLGVAPESVHGWIIGEHGDSSVAVWSSVNIAGVNLRDLNPNLATENDPDDWKCIHGEVVSGAYQVIALKGYTSWAIGVSVSDLCSTMLRNTAKVHCVSVFCQGMYGIEDEAFLSLPCTIGESGIINAIQQKLNDEELGKLRDSAKIMGDAVKELNIQ